MNEIGKGIKKVQMKKGFNNTFGRTAVGSAEYNKKVQNNNKWSKWESHGGPRGPGVEATLTSYNFKKAIAYGDPLIEKRLKRDGSFDVTGQIKIIRDADKRVPEAMDYLWLQFQDITIRSYWQNRLNTDEKKTLYGHDQKIWWEWLSLCWATLFNLPHFGKAAHIPGVSAIDGFDLKRYKLSAKVRTNDMPAPESALSALSVRFGQLLYGVATSLRNEEDSQGMTYVPFNTSEDWENNPDNKGIELTTKDRRWLGKKIRYSQMDDKLMDIAQTNEELEYSDLIKRETEKEAFEHVFKDSKETLDFLKCFKEALVSPRLFQVLPGGTRLCDVLPYAFGEPLGIKDGVYIMAESIADILKLYPVEDGKKIRNFIADLPEFFEEYDISKNEFTMMAKNHDVMTIMLNLTKSLK